MSSSILLEFSRAGFLVGNKLLLGRCVLSCELRFLDLLLAEAKVHTSRSLRPCSLIAMIFLAKEAKDSHFIVPKLNSLDYLERCRGSSFKSTRKLINPGEL